MYNFNFIKPMTRASNAIHVYISTISNYYLGGRGLSKLSDFLLRFSFMSS